MIFKIKRHGACKTSALRATAEVRGWDVTVAARDGVTFKMVGNWNCWMAVLPCPTCDRRYRVYSQLIHGKVNTNITCTAKCESATGPDCECFCGGENHGGRWS